MIQRWFRSWDRKELMTGYHTKREELIEPILEPIPDFKKTASIFYEHPIHESKKKRRCKIRSKRASYHASFNATGFQKFDPDLQLRYQHNGIEMIIPAAGKKFHYNGNVFVKRTNADNPLVGEKIQEDFMDLIKEDKKEF